MNNIPTFSVNSQDESQGRALDISELKSQQFSFFKSIPRGVKDFQERANLALQKDQDAKNRFNEESTKHMSSLHRMNLSNPFISPDPFIDFFK